MKLCENYSDCFEQFYPQLCTNLPQSHQSANAFRGHLPRGRKRGGNRHQRPRVSGVHDRGTKDIFDTYTQILAFLPQLQRVNASAYAKAPELSSAGEDSAPINITVTIEQNIGGNDSGSLKESNEELVNKIWEVIEETYRTAGEGHLIKNTRLVDGYF